MNGDYLTPKEAAAVLGFRDVDTVYAWLRAGRFPGAVRVGDGACARWRVPRASVLGVQRVWEPGAPPPPVRAARGGAMTPEEIAAKYPRLARIRVYGKG